MESTSPILLSYRRVSMLTMLAACQSGAVRREGYCEQTGDEEEHEGENGDEESDGVQTLYPEAEEMDTPIRLLGMRALGDTEDGAEEGAEH